MGVRTRSDSRGVTVHELDGELVIVSAPLRRPRARLTKAEHEVATLVARGLGNAEIATERRTSVRTVARQVATAMKKLGAVSRVSLAAKLAKRD